MTIAWDHVMWTVIFTFTGLTLMFVGLLLFDILVPFKLFTEVQNGNEAVGWLTAGYLISTGIILGGAFKANLYLDQAVVSGVLGILLNYVGYFLWEWLTPRWSLSRAIQQGDKAAGIVLFGIAIAIGLIVAGSFSPA